MEPSTQQGQGKGANPASGSAGAVPPPQRSPSQSSLHRSGHAASHRQSFAENLRNPPPSPRAHRVSFTQQAVQDLLNHPPVSCLAHPRFSGRDWRDVAVGELVSLDDVKWVTMETSVEEATKVSPRLFDIVAGRLGEPTPLNVNRSCSVTSVSTSSSS